MRSSLKMAVALTAVTMLTAGPALSPAAHAQATPGPSAQPAQPQEGKPQPGPTAANLSDQDRSFIQKLHKGGMMMVCLSTVAAKQSDDPKVREFAVKTLEDMGKAGGMLMAMAKASGIDLPKNSPDDVKRLTEALSKDTGSTLDREYMAQIVPGSTMAVNLFKDESKKGQDPKFVEFASEMLPKIEQHQQMAVDVSQNMGVSQAKQEQKEQKAGQPESGSSPPPGSEPQGAAGNGKTAAPEKPGAEK